MCTLAFICTIRPMYNLFHNFAMGNNFRTQEGVNFIYLDSRIEAFLGSLEKSLGELEAEEFTKQVEQQSATLATVGWV